MIPGLARYVRRAAIGVAMVAYPVLAYYTTAGTTAGGFGAILLAAAPLAGIAILLSWRSRWRPLVFLSCAAAFALLWHYSGPVREHLALLYFVEHAGTNVGLFVLFGRSLMAENEPLCSRFAASVRGPLEPRVARYTRQITVAWTLFFATMATVSSLLFFFAPVGAWATFANLLTLPLIAAMFIAEYAVRRRVLPDIRHTSIASAVRAFRQSHDISAPPPR
ncbi:MAG: hypothetical protein ABI831_03500 [Betaproteobacteria bacterium]